MKININDMSGLKLFLVFLFICASAYADRSTYTHNQRPLALKDLKNITGVTLTSASFSQDQVLHFGENILLVPEGSNVYFFPSTTHDLKIRSIAFKTRTDSFIWRFKNGSQVVLNCGSQGVSANFIHFSPSGDFLGPCTSIERLNFYQDNHQITVHQNSTIEFFPNGDLRAAKSATAQLNLFEQVLNTMPEAAIRYRENTRQIHYFFLESGESFYAPTELGPKTEFSQPSHFPNFPVLIHENGQLSTAIYTGPAALFSFTAFGTPIGVEVSNFPIGFNSSGKTDKVALQKPLKITVSKPTRVTRFNASENVPLGSRLFQPGESFIAPAAAQFLIDRSNDHNQITDIIIEEQGQIIIYSLSDQ